jgi:hypothetical protein
MSVLLDRQSTKETNFSWAALIGSIRKQGWQIHKVDSLDANVPAWPLLYDEVTSPPPLDPSEEVTMLLTLSHADTARIVAVPGTNASKGSQYFWLSKDCFDFFPPLTIRNRRGDKATFSSVVEVRFVDLDFAVDCMVTFEAENNLDFRLGTGPLRYSRIAKSGDLAILSRVGERSYQLRIEPKESPTFAKLAPHAVNFIGHKGKRYGFIENAELEKLTGIRLGPSRARRRLPPRG